MATIETKNKIAREVLSKLTVDLSYAKDGIEVRESLEFGECILLPEGVRGVLVSFTRKDN